MFDLLPLLNKTNFSKQTFCALYHDFVRGRIQKSSLGGGEENIATICWGQTFQKGLEMCGGKFVPCPPLKIEMKH